MFEPLGDLVAKGFFSFLEFPTLGKDLPNKEKGMLSVLKFSKKSAAKKLAVWLVDSILKAAIVTASLLYFG